MMHDYPILLNTAISQVRAGNTSRDANILLDEGAQRSFITTKLADELGAKLISKENIAMSAFGSTEHSHRRLDVTMVDIITDNGDRIPLQVLVVPQIAHPVSGGNFEINLLVGADYYWDIVQDKIIRGDGGPTAVQSRLGYLFSGPLKSNRVQNDVTNILHLAASTNEEFHLQKFWSLESMGIFPQIDPPPRKRIVLTSYQATSITRSDDGAYAGGFPWKEEHPPLPRSWTTLLC